jgi:hypothetical protein
MRRIVAAVSVSATASIEPPVRRARSIAYAPSAGEPIESERTIVSGARTGTISPPFAKAVATGAQPFGWPPTNRTSVRSTSPIAASSSKPFATFVNSEPDAIGPTTTSGRSTGRPPSASAGR